MPFTLPPRLFQILCSLIEDRLGIACGPNDLPVFSEKITARATETGFESVLDYYYFLRYDPGASAELDALADTLVIGETYFFRELEQARAGVAEVLVPLVARNGQARVWCAGCATGEEPLTIAMLLAEAGIADRCEIVATDLSARAIARAREGYYKARSLRALEPGAEAPGWTSKLVTIASASIVREGSGGRVSPALVATIDYRQSNLLDAAAVRELGMFDLILCRNVLIYFGDETIVRVTSSLTGALTDQGALLVGASESLLRFGTALRCAERGGAFFYTRAPS
jgi:chemotaxis protein methyltransferase CheR